MVLVDTSVLVDFLKGHQSAKVGLLEEVLIRDIPFGISICTYQEVLQGARNEREFNKLREYLGTQILYYPSDGMESYEKAARLFFDLRRHGITVRGTIDMLIAVTAMENNLLLLHNDHDFDAIATVATDLRILKSL